MIKCLIEKKIIKLIINKIMMHINTRSENENQHTHILLQILL